MQKKKKKALPSCLTDENCNNVSYIHNVNLLSLEMCPHIKSLNLGIGPGKSLKGP